MTESFHVGYCSSGSSVFNWRATLFSLTFDSAFKFEIGLKFLNCKKSASGFLSRGDNTADFKHLGMQPSRRERLTMLVTVGSNRSVHCLMIEDGNGSKTQQPVPVA